MIGIVSRWLLIQANHWNGTNHSLPSSRWVRICLRNTSVWWTQKRLWRTPSPQGSRRSQWVTFPSLLARSPRQTWPLGTKHYPWGSSAPMVRGWPQAWMLTILLILRVSVGCAVRWCGGGRGAVLSSIRKSLILTQSTLWYRTKPLPNSVSQGSRPRHLSHILRTISGDTAATFNN